jgi:hypothetical protein
MRAVAVCFVFVVDTASATFQKLVRIGADFFEMPDALH